jgi:hypothetical protein
MLPMGTNHSSTHQPLYPAFWRILTTGNRKMNRTTNTTIKRHSEKSCIIICFPLSVLPLSPVTETRLSKGCGHVSSAQRAASQAAP